MKILHVCNHFHPCIGGIEKYVYDLCKNLQKLGHQSDVCCLDRCAYGKEKSPAYENYDGISIFRLPFLDLKWYNVAPGVVSLVKDYDVIHIHSIGFFSDFLILTKPLHGKPIILNTHGGIFHTRYLQLLKDVYFNFCCRALFKSVYKILADGESDKRRFDEISHNVDIVPITVDTKKYMGLKRAPRRGRLLYVGRLSKNKRIDNLIKTFAFVKKAVPHAELYIVGPAWDDLDVEMKALAESLGIEKSVVFTGEVSDRELMNQIKLARVFLFASEYEGRPVTLMEMLAAGIPMVVNDIPIFRDFITDGRNGFVADYTNHKAAADKIVHVMDGNLSKISKSARQSSKKYDWGVAIKKIENIYKAALTGRLQSG